MFRRTMIVTGAATLSLAAALYATGPAASIVDAGLPKRLADRLYIGQ